MELNKIFEEYEIKAFKYDLLMKKIDKEINRTEKWAKTTDSEMKRIILKAKVCFLKELKEIDTDYTKETNCMTD